MSAGTQARLVLMANQIARNLAAMEGAHAAAAVADHIGKFWDPRMRAAILADRAGLDPLAAEAIEILARTMPAPEKRHATGFGMLGDPGPSGAA
jgi:formate dehydrogenase subunit delta